MIGAWLQKLWPQTPPVEVYVVFERHTPIGVCVERDTARVLADTVKHTDVRIHLVPFVADK